MDDDDHCGTNGTNKSHNKILQKYSNLCSRHFCFAATKRAKEEEEQEEEGPAPQQRKQMRFFFFFLLPIGINVRIPDTTTTAERTIGSTHALPASRNLSLYIARCYFAGSPTPPPPASPRGQTKLPLLNAIPSAFLSTLPAVTLPGHPHPRPPASPRGQTKLPLLNAIPSAFRCLNSVFFF
jgi:hypothetical protein